MSITKWLKEKNADRWALYDAKNNTVNLRFSSTGKDRPNPVIGEFSKLPDGSFKIEFYAGNDESGTYKSKWPWDGSGMD